MNFQSVITNADLIRKEMPSGWTYTRVTTMYFDVLQAAITAARNDQTHMLLRQAVKDHDIHDMVLWSFYSEHNTPSKYDGVINSLIQRLRDGGFTVTVNPDNSDYIIKWI